MVQRLRRLFGTDPLSARPRQSPLLLGLTLGLALATTALVWFGCLATREWQRNAAQLVDRRAQEVLALLVAAITRDMKGAQVSVFVPINHETIASEPPHDFREAWAGAFARFPYPESFFVWKHNGTNEGLTYCFNRADRPPAWDTTVPTLDPYPVVLVLKASSPFSLQVGRLSRDLQVTARDLARFGSGIIVDFEEPGGARVLVWTE